MFIWYWTVVSPNYGATNIDDANYAWTDLDCIQYCIVRPSDCCFMIPPTIGEWSIE